MIIDDQNKFVFVHIPKCAGSSIRSKLDVFDTTGGFLRPPVQEVDGVGLLDLAHLPLSEL